MDAYKFTIHVPVYNVEDFLEECIDSLINQTYKNFEIILTDDGSTDSSGKICDVYAQKYKNIRVFHNQNQGLVLTRRFSIEKAKGEFSLFVDSDDYIEQNMLERILQIIQDNNCDLVVFHYKSICSDGELRIKPIWKEFTVFNDTKKDVFCKEFFFSNHLNNLCMKAVKTELLLSDNIDYKKISYVRNGEDFIQSINVVLNANKIVYTPEVFYNYRINLDSMTRKIDLYRYKSLLTTSSFGMEYLKKSSICSIEGIQKYATLSMHGLIKFIKEVCHADTLLDDKFKVFSAIKDENYYRTSLLKNVNPSRLSLSDRMIYKLFTNGNYKILVLFVVKSTKILHFLRGLKKGDVL